MLKALKNCLASLSISILKWKRREWDWEREIEWERGRKREAQLEFILRHFLLGKNSHLFSLSISLSFFLLFVGMLAQLQNRNWNIFIIFFSLSLSRCCRRYNDNIKHSLEAKCINLWWRWKLISFPTLICVGNVFSIGTVWLFFPPLYFLLSFILLRMGEREREREREREKL